ncbi:MAG: hypothetical protein FWH53_00520 [Leptospirales bacterium]|nr:hypothetical protein [Leptospirales bacterium]
MNRYFRTTNFRYIRTRDSFVPDSLLLFQDNKCYQVVFDQEQGWIKSVRRQVKKYEVDLVLGVVKNEDKKFRIYLEDECIEWVRRKIDYEDIIT